MHIKSLCFILPEENFDTHKSADDKKTQKVSSNRNCSLALDLLRRSLVRFFDTKCMTCCHQQVSNDRFLDVFYDTEGVQIEEKLGGENPRIFSYSELYIGSNGFSEKGLLGSGGFGRVYRAVLPGDKTTVAVKCLVERGERIEKTFMAELMAVAHLRHRNLVRLRGWCIHDEELLLVYDYMPNRSLDRVLFKRPKNGDSAVLTWERRKKIVTGLAAALNYLHEQLETQIIHRDVKTSNVMLDSHFNARLGDFGLARWLEHDLRYEAKTPTVFKDTEFRLAETTRIGGTIGYLPPESFQKRGVATSKSDVFSFGIVMLEVISGRRAVDLTYPDDRIILLDWIRRLWDQGIVLQAGDARLENGSYTLTEMEHFVYLGLMCTLQEPQSRPTMKWILEALSGNLYGKLPELPSFRSHPRYISFSSTDNSTSTNNTTFTKSWGTGSHSSTTSTTFYSANGDTIYMSAETETSSTPISSKSSYERQKSFPVIETPKAITFEEIIRATDNFADSKRVAELDFGTAYHGFLENRHVLVKRLGMTTCPALRMRFSNEFQNLGRLYHRNLTQLRGWCTEQGEMLVVYDYTSNRLLSHILFHHDCKNERATLSWHQRYNIIKSLASAIYYLHEEWDEQVIHKNITSSAVILDPDMNPRLGSFALAEFLIRNEHGPHIVIDKRSSVRGIFGYMSPEYMDCGEATTMADVYSFGVVILEVICGQMAVDFRQRDVLLVKRAHDFFAQERPFQELVDMRLDGQYNEKELERLLKLGMACIHSHPELRPSMRQIVSILDGHDNWLIGTEQRKDGTEDWRQRNAASLSLVRRIQALGIQ